MIKKATQTDRDVLAKLIRESFRDIAHRFELTAENCPKHPSNCTSEWIDADIERGVQYYILYADEAPIGCVGVEKANADTCYIERLSVIPGMRGSRFGTELLRYALERAVSIGARKVGIGIIDEQDELKAWYKRLGFIETQKRNFPHLPFTVCLMEFELAEKAG